MTLESGLVQFASVFGFELFNSPVDFLVAHHVIVLVADGSLLLVFSVLKILKISDVHCLGSLWVGLVEIGVPAKLGRKGRKTRSIVFASFCELLGIVFILIKFVILFIERVARIWLNFL